MQEPKGRPDGRREYRSTDGPDYASYDEILQKRAADGTTGEISPNVEQSMLVRQYVQNFQHDPSGLTQEDCYFVLTKARLGTDKDGDPDHDILLAAHGAPIDLTATLAFALAKDPVLLDLFTQAVQFARQHRLKKELGGFFDKLAHVFGHNSTEEWTEAVQGTQKSKWQERMDQLKREHEGNKATPNSSTDKPATDANNP